MTKKIAQKTHLEHGNKGYIEDQREFFDKLVTEDWDAYLNPHWDRTRRFEVQQILHLVPHCQSVLDVGCGCGYHDLIFARAAGIERVVGIDYSIKSIERANTHYPHPKVTRFTADIFSDHEMITRAGYFDLVTSFQVIEHLTNPVEFLAACAACAPVGGYVAVVTPNKMRLVNRVRRCFGRVPGLGDPLHFDEYAISDFITMGQKIGLAYTDHFGHSTSFGLKGITLIEGNSAFALKLGQYAPTWANVIGVVFQKKQQ